MKQRDQGTIQFYINPKVSLINRFGLKPIMETSVHDMKKLITHLTVVKV